MVVPTVSSGRPRIECCTTIAGSVIECGHGASADSVNRDGGAMEAKVDVVADLAGKEGALAADKVVMSIGKLFRSLKKSLVAEPT